MEIRYGLKLWSSEGRLAGAAEKLVENGIFHYVELTPVPGTDIDPFTKNDIPYIIHATTERYGVNIADIGREEFNRAHLERCIHWADLVDAEGIVLHPGFGEIADALVFLERLSDPRILIENMPFVGLGGEKMIGSTPEEMKELRSSRFGFCLDLNHAIKAAVSLKKPYPEHIREFMALEPDLFHIADGSLHEEKDEHLPLGKGDYDLKFLKSCIERSACRQLTFETPRLSGNLQDDVMNVSLFRDV